MRPGEQAGKLRWAGKEVLTAIPATTCPSYRLRWLIEQDFPISNYPCPGRLLAVGNHADNGLLNICRAERSHIS